MINYIYGDLELNGRSQPFSVTPDQGDTEYAKKILKPNGGTPLRTSAMLHTRTAFT